MDRGLGTGVAVDGAVGRDAVEGDPGGRVVGRGTGRVGAEEPRRDDAGEPVPRAAGGDQRLHARVDAVGDLVRVEPGRQPAVVGPAGGQHPRVEGERVAGRRARQARVAEDVTGPGQRGRHLRGPGVPVRAGQRPRQHAAEGPGAGVAAGHLRDAVGEPGQHVPGLVGAAGALVGDQPEHRLGGGVGALGDQPGRGAPAVDLEVLPVPAQHLAVERGDGQVEPVLQEAGERGVGVPEGGVPLAERPDGAGQPVGRVAVGRVGQLLRLGARVQGAVGLHPEHDVAGVRAGRGLQVGETAEHLEGAGAARRGAGLPPVAQVHDGGAGHVVGVERALPVGVGGRVVGAAADPLEVPPSRWSA